ncbi:MAG: PAS domain S-box protein [Desulfobulbaceae bacterium]|nr:PAS domain S-box protein [Desulfobulbaceae bacterium]
MANPDDKTNSNQSLSKENFENLEREIDLRTRQLLEANQQLKREIGERKRAEQITRTLFRISNAVNTAKDLGDLYASIHSILKKVIDLNNFFIAIYDKKASRVSFPYFVDQFDSGSIYADQFSEENSLTGTVITTQNTVFLNKTELQQRGAENRVIGTVPTAWIGVPLKIKEEVIGVMAAQSYEDQHCFNAIDLDILTSVSDQVAIAIERKSNEQAIITSEKRYRNIIESIEDGYYEIDLKGDLTLINQAMCRMLGYSEEELLGNDTVRYINKEMAQQFNDAFAAVLATDIPGKILEFEYRSKGEGLRYAETVVSAIRNDEQEPTGFRGIVRDTTERKATEKSRRALADQLQQSQRLESLGTLAGGIAHDFNNLLMGIQGRTALMLNGLAEEHPHYSQLENIEEYVASAAKLTTRLLGFARGGKYEVRPVELNSLIEKSIQLFGRTKKEITIKTTLQSDVCSVEVDANQIEQVLLNLLVNAGQAMPEGGLIKIATSQVILKENDARLYSISPGNYVQLTLSDTGGGMDNDTMQKIFDPFFTTKSIGYGTGLGLAMVYGIIRNHSGAISVKSALNQGAVFTILLPSTDKKGSTEDEKSLVVEKGTETILLVDDEPMILEVGQEILAALGYRVLSAASGQEAIDAYSETQYKIDLFIIDMIMPHMSGSELFDRLRKINPTVKVLLSSGYSINGQAREIINRGCKGFIQKPFSISQLSVKIREILS